MMPLVLCQGQIDGCLRRISCLVIVGKPLI